MESLPPRERGLKYIKMEDNPGRGYVAPSAGA